MKHRFVLALIFIIALSSCSNNPQQENNTQEITEKPVMDSIYIKFEPSYQSYAEDLSIIDPKREQLMIKSDTNFRAYPFSEYSSLLLATIPQEAIFPIERGDSLIISEQKYYPHIKILNNNRYSEKEINFSSELAAQRLSIFSYLFYMNQPLDDAYKGILNTIDSLNTIKGLSDEYTSWIKKETKFAYLQLTQTKNVLKSKRDIPPFQDDENLKYYNYRRLLTTYAGNFLSANPPLDSIISIVDKHFTGKGKDYVLYRLASNNLESSNKDKIKLDVEKLENHFSDSSFYTLIKDRFLPIFQVNNAMKDPLLRPNGSSISFDQMLEKHQGKIIYIDIWASWCAPCRAEMPKSLELKAKHKDIAFVYLSTDKQQSDWLKANSIEKLGEENSYLFGNPNDSNFIKTYKVKSIPRYFLVDKKGVVVNIDAPRPSDPKLESLFNDLK